MEVSVIDYFLSALDYFKAGYMTMPLTLDAQGFPKRPIVPGWSQLPYSLDALKKLPWEEARGLGIVLGPASKNLAILDIDDVELTGAIAQLTKHTRTVKTIRGRCHVYMRERSASKPRSLTVTWRDNPIKIEFKCQGTQVAAPPTPGYSFLSEAEPKQVESIQVAWNGLARRLGIESNESGENYPRPWRDKVIAGERNKSAYVEAHLLRKAHMPLPLALRIMQIRWETDYDKGEITWDEIARTVQSAYINEQPPITDIFTDDVEWN